MWWLIIPQYGASCSLYFDFMTSLTLWYSCYNLFKKLSCKNLKSYLCLCVCVCVCVCVSYCCITSCMYIERYLLNELLDSPFCYLSFQAYSLLACDFCWTFKTYSFSCFCYLSFQAYSLLACDFCWTFKTYSFNCLWNSKFSLSMSFFTLYICDRYVFL